MNQQKVRIEDLIKRDDFISMTNEGESFGSSVCGYPVHSFYKVKMRSRRELSGRGTPFQSWRYFDVFDHEQQFPEYYIMVSKPWQPTYHYIVDKNFNVTVRNGFDPSPLVNGEQLFTTKKAADMYVYENKKVATQKELDQKAKAAYQNGRDAEFYDRSFIKMTEEQRRIDERRRLEIALGEQKLRDIQAIRNYEKAFGELPKWSSLYKNL